MKKILRRRFARDFDALLLSGSRLFQADWYLSNNPDVAASGFTAVEHYLRFGGVEGRAPSPLFYGEVYLARRPDVARSGINPLVHFLRYGISEIGPEYEDYGVMLNSVSKGWASESDQLHFWAEDADLLSSSGYFDASWYLAMNADVAGSGIDALSHYLTYGAAEGRHPGPNFDSDAYLSQHPAVAASGTNPLVHFLRYGGAGAGSFGVTGPLAIRDGQDDETVVRASKYFDAGWYLGQNRDVEAAGFDPVLHYIAFGAEEGRNPGPYFDGGLYLLRRPDVAASGINPLVHFLRWGFLEVKDDLSAHGILPIRDPKSTSDLRDPSGPEEDRNLKLLRSCKYFDADWYLQQNADVKDAGLDAAKHYLDFGAAEGREPGPLFDSRKYIAHFPDVGLRGINPLLDFIRRGIAEIAGALEALGFPARREISSEHSNRRRNSGRVAVFVTHDLNIGGAPTLLATIAKWFQERTNYDVRIVAMNGGPLAPVFEQIAPLHVVGKIDISHRDIAQLQARLHEFVGEEPAFTFINSVAAGDYCKIDPYEAPVFGYVHEMPAILTLFKDRLKSLLAHADHIFCGGKNVYEYFLSTEGLPESKLTNRPAFIEALQEQRSWTAAEKRAQRVALGWSPDTKIVVGCGVLHWRKQPAVFVRMAAKLALEWNRDVRFVWVGDGEDLSEMRKLSRTLNVSDRIEFLGHREDFRSIFAAADVFALTSLEDPFPLVCLEASVVGAPSVIFREATGMTALVEPDCEPPAGLAVPLNDEEAYFAAVDRLLGDDVLRENMARSARERVLSQYTAERACAEILKVIREIAGIAPLVSVVVPSYNCGEYLGQRLQSIAGQSFKDIEILLLDDVSQDNSREILEQFAAENIYAKLHFASENSGSVFKAWKRGIEVATGELIWLAEADDWCEPTFLEKAIAAFDVSGVRLVHGRSIPVRADGEVAGDWNDLYLDRISIGRWRESFVSPSFREVNETLGRANTIPNASAVVVRRQSALRAIRVATKFKLAGDWAFYLVAIAGGRIAYCHDAINYHRRHDTSVTAKVEGGFEYFQELQDVYAIVEALYGVNDSRKELFDKHVAQEVKRFAFDQVLPAPRVPTEINDVRHPAVLYGVGDLSGGGAQMFAVRFVNSWVSSAASAVLFVAGHEPDNPGTARRLSPEVAVVNHRDIEEAGGLSRFMADWGLEIVVSGHWWGDRALGKLIARADAHIPWIIIMHGCYENVLSNAKAFPTMLEDMKTAELYCDHWVWTAEKNKEVFEAGYIEPKRISNIVNGFQPVSGFDLTRSDVGLPDGALVFTLASRAIAAKGWNVAVEAFKELRQRFTQTVDVRLLLIGDGPEADTLRSAGEVDGLHLVRHTTRLAEYINLSDVCLLPSWFAGESLPLVLLEFLAQGKPAIVSDIGQCAWAIQAGEATAGLVVPLDTISGEVRCDVLSRAMETFIVERSRAQMLERCALQAFEKFDMNRMVGEYKALTIDVLNEASPR
ncbi:glycosyltransferase [Ensifer sp. HO-A22]|uniref:Glycosyltransferase n=1 Tax=Ensifer oleiphilus TaxID=2742698 RepID=A0A7Y6UN16_9HYPH|nr:glycosyltransferase [Ensifer oleiphilus]